MVNEKHFRLIKNIMTVLSRRQTFKEKLVFTLGIGLQVLIEVRLRLSSENLS